MLPVSAITSPLSGIGMAIGIRDSWVGFLSLGDRSELNFVLMSLLVNTFCTQQVAGLCLILLTPALYRGTHAKIKIDQQFPTAIPSSPISPAAQATWRSTSANSTSNFVLFVSCNTIYTTF
jgi:hypothetical protein